MRQTQNTQKKNNRRSILVIALLLMLVAVIGFGGYTLSKYVTKKSADANASVAKWGFTATADASNLFGTNYKFVDSNSVVTTDTAKLTVKSSDDNKKVAPGTTGSMTFKVEGKAEVLAQVKFELTGINEIVLKYTKNNVAGVDYAPVKWTLQKNGADVTGAKNVSLAEINEILKGTECTETIQPGETSANEYTLSWAWEFESADNAELNNALDTLLGMYANDKTTTENGDYKVVEGTKTEVSFTLNITISQLKEAA